MKKTMLMMIIAVVGINGAMARQPVQLSLTPEIAFFDRSEQINGLALSVWGENPQRALALGLVNGSTGQSAGLSLSFILNYADDYKGVQWAAVNYTKDDFLGWQSAVLNYAGGTMKGLQTGIVNYADKLTGVQFGVINFAESAETGVQVGLLNLLPENAWFNEFPDQVAPGMVFLNWGF